MGIADVADRAWGDEYDGRDGMRADVGRFDAVVVRTFVGDRGLLDRTDRLTVVSKHGSGLDNVEIVGSAGFRYLDVGGRGCRVRSSSEAEPNEGEVVDVTFSETDLHLFDRTTEEAIVHGHHRAEAAPREIGAGPVEQGARIATT